MAASRRRFIRAALVLLLVTIASAVCSPAFAAGVDVRVVSQFEPFTPGDTQSLKLHISSGGASSVTVSISGLSDFTAGNPRGCADGGGSSCIVVFGGGSAKDITFSVTATGHVDAGQSRIDHGTVTARQNVLLGGAATATFEATLTAREQTPTPTATRAPSVASVSGVVTDATNGHPVTDAVVLLVDGGACARDSGRQPCQAATDDDGEFRFTSSPARPLAPGTISLGARKDGYNQARVSVTARAGQSVTVSLRLAPAAAAGSPAPSLAATAGGQQPMTGTAPLATPATQSPADSGVLSPALIAGGLLALLGTGAFAAMLRRGSGDHAYRDSPFALRATDSGHYPGPAHDDQPTVVRDVPDYLMDQTTAPPADPGPGDSWDQHGRDREGEYWRPPPEAAASPHEPPRRYDDDDREQFRWFHE